jgi:sec-independent protein translocase protein TatC
VTPVPTLERSSGSQSARDPDRLVELTDAEELDHELESGRMTFLEHLDELRKRLVMSIIGVAFGCVVSFLLLDRWIFPFIMLPIQGMLPAGGSLITTEAFEYFMLWLKVGLLSGVLIAMPFVLYQVWLFVAPGLYAHEKRFAVPFVLSSSICFFAGAAFSHYIAFPTTWMFFVNFTADFVQFMPRVGPAFALYVKLLIGLGIIFQTPVLIFALARMGVVSAGFLARNLKYAVLISFILGAFLSGPDVMSQFMMAGPMIVLYVVGIGIAWVFQKKRTPDE